MENTNLINKINEIIISNADSKDKTISLNEYILLVENIQKEIELIYKETIKKINKKLHSNIVFFEQVITNLVIKDNIEITFECNVIRETLIFDKKTLKIINPKKEKTSLEKFIRDDLQTMLSKIEQHEYLEKIKIKEKLEDINVIINRNTIELFVYKSPNWITMGKSFVLLYDFKTKNFKYEVDSINIKNILKDQEKLLFSKINIDLRLLPLEMQQKYDYYKKLQSEKINKKESIIMRFTNKIKNIFQKK